MSAAPELEFDSKAWNDMPPAERIRRCMQFAREANQLASAASADVRDAYADLAKQWLDLAAEIEEARADDRPSS
jgi:hypothetical protein